MNRRGESGGDNQVLWYFAYLFFGIAFFVFVLWYVQGIKDRASLQEQFYSQEIANLINNAEDGAEIYLDVSQAYELGLKNKVLASQMFVIDPVANSVKVSLSPNSGTQFFYYRNIDAFIVPDSFTLESDGKLHISVREVRG